MSGPGGLEGGDGGLRDLPEGREDELAANKGVLPVYQVTVGGHIAIAGNEEAGTDGGDLFGLFDVIEGRLEESGGTGVHFPENDIELLLGGDAAPMVQILYGIQQGI